MPTAASKKREELGILAIIYLQSLVGIQETRGKARTGWRRMPREQQNTTLSLYATLKPSDPGEHS